VQTLVQKYPNAKMTVTGHSLGAALSTISAIEMNKKSPKLATELHTFGCPRIGNAKLAQFIGEEF
jgi:predicted lipase